MKGYAIVYSDEQLAYLKRNSKLLRKELTEKFNQQFSRKITQQNIEAICKRNGWMTGRNGQFIKGQSKIPGSGAKTANKTSFKKGNIPHNHRSVGYERISKDGYIEIKTAEPNIFRLKQRVNYEKANGPIEPELIIRFIDGNPLNCDPDNLEKITRHEHILLNKSDYKNERPEIKPAIRTLVKLESKLHRMTS